MLKELGHELVKLDKEDAEAELQYGLDKVADVMDNIQKFFEKVDWGLRMEEMWDGIGQSEEDAEYG